MNHNVYNLDDAVKAESRRPIDASWSPAKKKAVAGVCIVAAAGAVGYGAWAMLSSRPPSLPTTATDALAVINSAKFSRLDAERKEQYLAETMRLVRELPEEQRREFFRDEKHREAFRKFMDERFDEMARKFARGEDLSSMWQGFGPPRGERPQRPEGEQRPQPTEEERAQRMEQMRAEMNKRMGEQIKSGNAQSGGLRSEMMQRMGGGRGGFGMGGRGPGGGGGPGGGRGGAGAPGGGGGGGGAAGGGGSGGAGSGSGGSGGGAPK